MSRIFRGLVIPLLSAVVFGLVADTGTAAVTLPHAQDWDTISPWTQVYNGSSLDGSQSVPSSSSPSLRFNYTKGMYNGTAPDKVWVSWTPTQSEVWTQYYFKYSSNFYFHTTDNKQAYWYISESKSNWYVSCSSGQKMRMVFQRNSGDNKSGTRFSNTSYNPTIERDTWYNLTVRAVMNTGETANGIFQMWINDQLVMNHSDIAYLVGTDVGRKVVSMSFDPVFGGMAGLYKPADDYFWVGRTIISTDPLELVPPSLISGVMNPLPPSRLSIK